MVSIIFELSVNVLQCGMVLIFMSAFFGSKFQGIKRISGFLFAWLVLFVELTYINHLMSYEGAIILIPALICFFYALICLKGSVLIQAFISVFIISIIHTLAVISNLVTGFFLGINNPTALITEFNVQRIVYVLTINAIFFCVLWALLKIKESYSIRVKEWIPLTCIPILSTISLSVLMDIVIQNSDRNIQSNIVLAAFVILIINVVVYYMLIRLGKENHIELEYALLQQQYNYEKMKSDDTKSLYENIVSMRHDMKNHLTAISALLEDKQNDEAKDYICRIIEYQIDNTQKLVFTSNERFNAILSAKLSMCAKENINITVGIKDPVNFMSVEDISVLFGNLFDNAIEACKRTDQRQIHIKVQIQGAYVSVFMANTIIESVMIANPELITTKRDPRSHGYGIKNIKKIVEKYNGIIEFWEENNLFCCDILLENLPTTN